MTPWEVLGLDESETGDEVLRAAHLRRLKQFASVADARHWIDTAYDILRNDPTGADPYGLLDDPWGKWQELLDSHPLPVPARAQESTPSPPRIPELDPVSDAVPESGSDPVPAPVLDPVPAPVAVPESTPDAPPPPSLAPPPPSLAPPPPLVPPSPLVPPPLPSAPQREPGPEPAPTAAPPASEPGPDLAGEFERRFRDAAHREDSRARVQALREIAHQLADLAAADADLIPLWARLLLTYCGTSSGTLQQVVRRKDLRLDLFKGDATVTTALLDEGDRQEDFRIVRFVAGTLLKEIPPHSSRRVNDLFFRCAQRLALFRPQTARSLLETLQQAGRKVHAPAHERESCGQRIRAGEEMLLWGKSLRLVVAQAEARGTWDGDRRRRGTPEALLALARVSHNAQGQSELEAVLRDRVPTLMQAALAPQAQEQSEGREAVLPVTQTGARRQESTRPARRNSRARPLCQHA